MLKRLSTLSLAGIVVVSLCGISVAHEHDNNSGQHSAIQYGYHNGYIDGFAHGREDRQARVGYDFESRDYDSAMRGYEPYMGNEGEYRNGYRDGYIAGYNDGFRGHGARFEGAYEVPPYNGDNDDYRSGNRFNQTDVAFRVGYEDGLIQGGKDRRGNKNFQPSKHDRYEDADHGYSSDYGTKKEYKREYREGYLDGYQKGYDGSEGPMNP